MGMKFWLGLRGSSVRRHVLLAGSEASPQQGSGVCGVTHRSLNATRRCPECQQIAAERLWAEQAWRDAMTRA